MKVRGHHALIFVSSLIGAALPAHAQISPATPDKIAEAVSACMGAAKADGVDEAVLLENGWERAETTKDGKAVDVGLRFYGRAGNHALVLIGAAEEELGKLCMVSAAMTDPSEYQGVVDAIDALDGVDAVKQDKFDITFSTGDRIIFSQITGTPEKPDVRIAVSSVKALNSEK